MLFCTFVLNVAVGWQAAGEQEDMPSYYQETKLPLGLLTSATELEA